jgi:hypothetical protein
VAQVHVVVDVVETGPTDVTFQFKVLHNAHSKYLPTLFQSNES